MSSGLVPLAMYSALTSIIASVKRLARKRDRFGLLLNFQSAGVLEIRPASKKVRQCDQSVATVEATGANAPRPRDCRDRHSAAAH